MYDSIIDNKLNIGVIPLNFVQLKYFVEIVETQSLTIASQNLFVTQPTLSQSLKKLEEKLNTRLLTRTDNLYQPTESGQLLYDKGKEIIKLVDILNEDLYKLNAEPTKEKLHLGITTLFSLQFMEEISTFMMLYPQIELIITQDGSRELQRMLKNKLLDVSVLSFPNTEQDSVHMEKLTNTTTTGYHVSVVVPKDNPLSQKDKLTFDQLKEQRFSSLTDNFIIGQMLIDRTKKFGYEANIIAFHNDLQVLLHSLTSSNSITLLPIEYNTIYQTPDLKWIPLDDLQNFFPIGIGVHRDTNLSEHVLDFIDIIKEN